MATKVKVKNFQSIQNATVDIEGFTVITGKNNSGKTALQRAIKGVFENTRGHSFVRHGEDHCEVSVSFDDGNKVTWYKGKKENKYVINGKTYDKVGAGVPEPLEELGIYPITCGGKAITPQFAPQFTGQVFLLNETGSVLAEAVSDVERVSLLNKALKESEKDKRAANSELKVRKKDLKAHEADLSFYDGLEAVGSQIDSLENLEEELNTLKESIQELSSLKDKYTKAQSLVEFLLGVDSLSVPEDTLTIISEEIEEVVSANNRLTRCDKSIVLIQNILGGISEHTEVLSSDKPSSIERCSSGISLLQGYQSRVLSCDKELDTIQEEILSIEKQLSQVQAELHSSLMDHSECPLCGGGL